MEDLFPNMLFNLVYKDRMLSITVPRTKLISYVKTKAYNLFGPMRHRIVLMYKNKALTPYEEKAILSFFKSMRQANILIVDSATVKNMISKTLDQSMNKSGSAADNLPSINRSNSPFKDTSTSTPQIKRYQTKCSECGKEKINFYCRDCAVFLCKYCRMNKGGNHYSHRTVTLYPEDLNKSAVLYKEVVNGMLHDAMNTQYKLRGTKQKKLNIQEMKENLLKKFDSLMIMTEAMKEDYPKLENVNPNQKAFNKEIEDAIEKIKKNEKGQMAMERFDEINAKEKGVMSFLQIGNDILKYEKLNNKIEGIMKSLENKLNKVISNAENDKFNLNKGL